MTTTALSNSMPWIQAVIDGLESLGREWRIYIGSNYIEFEQWIGRYGYDFVFDVSATSLHELCDQVTEYYESYDADEEALLWLRNGELGQNGLPPSIRELVDEMEESDRELEQLVIDLNCIRTKFEKENHYDKEIQ